MITIEEVENTIVDAKRLPGNPFIKQWKCHLIPNFEFFYDCDLSTLMDSIEKSYDDKTLYVYNFLWYPRSSDESNQVDEFDYYWEIPTGTESFLATVQKSVFSEVGGIYIFGPSKKWALVCPEHDYIVVGGEDKFIERFEMAKGGTIRIVSRIVSYMRKGRIPESEIELIVKSIYGPHTIIPTASSS